MFELHYWLSKLEPFIDWNDIQWIYMILDGMCTCVGGCIITGVCILWVLWPSFFFMGQTKHPLIVKSSPSNWCKSNWLGSYCHNVCVRITFFWLQILNIFDSYICAAQVSQLGAAAQKYQAAAQNASSNVPVSELQTNCNM